MSEVNNADILRGLGACSDAVDWAPEGSAYDAWRTCPRGDWLFWLLERISFNRGPIVAALCTSARRLLPAIYHWEDPAVYDAVAGVLRACEEWTKGQITPTDLENRVSRTWRMVQQRGRRIERIANILNMTTMVFKPGYLRFDDRLTRADLITISLETQMAIIDPNASKVSADTARIVRNHVKWQDVKKRLHFTIDDLPRFRGVRYETVVIDDPIRSK